jgi:hypothetical protein
MHPTQVTEFSEEGPSSQTIINDKGQRFFPTEKRLESVSATVGCENGRPKEPDDLIVKPRKSLRKYQADKMIRWSTILSVSDDCLIPSLELGGLKQQLFPSL